MAVDTGSEGEPDPAAAPTPKVVPETQDSQEKVLRLLEERTEQAKERAELTDTAARAAVAAGAPGAEALQAAAVAAAAQAVDLAGQLAAATAAGLRSEATSSEAGLWGVKLAALNTGLLGPCLLLAKDCLWAEASFWAAILCCFSMTAFWKARTASCLCFSSSKAGSA